MFTRKLGVFLLAASTVTAIAAGNGPHLVFKVVVPPQFQSKVGSPGFPGTSPFERYSQAYEAFWWNCVAVRAKNINARCPFIANGWASESYGGSDGAMNADNAIDEQIKKYGASRVQAYLKKLASPASAIKEKLHGWFGGQPTATPPPPS